MNKEFKLPDVGEGLTEADIVSWHVKPGDTITINQVIVEIETAKAVVELPSPYAGTVSALLVNEGQTVDVGTPIIDVDVPVAGEAPAPDGRPGPGHRRAAAPAPGHSPITARPPAGPRRLRRQAGLDQPPPAQERPDPPRLLPHHAGSPAQRPPAPGTARSPRSSPLS